MKFDVKFTEENDTFKAEFGESNGVSDGGYERGYEAGYTDGYTIGLNVPKQIGDLSKYIKFTAKPESSSSFTIKNPLGGIAKKVFLQATSEPISTVTVRRHAADYDLGIGAIQLASLSEERRYASIRVDGTPSNQQFSISDGVIHLNRVNSANIWDVNSEFEVEIYQ